MAARHEGMRKKIRCYRCPNTSRTRLSTKEGRTQATHAMESKKASNMTAGAKSKCYVQQLLVPRACGGISRQPSPFRMASSFVLPAEKRFPEKNWWLLIILGALSISEIAKSEQSKEWPILSLHSTWPKTLLQFTKTRDVDLQVFNVKWVETLMKTATFVSTSDKFVNLLGKMDTVCLQQATFPPWSQQYLPECLWT